MILSFAAAQSDRRRKTRLASMAPYCGPCLEEWGDVNDLLPITLWAANGEPVQGHYCPFCGEEFRP